MRMTGVLHLSILLFFNIVLHFLSLQLRGFYVEINPLTQKLYDFTRVFSLIFVKIYCIILN